MAAEDFERAQDLKGRVADLRGELEGSRDGWQSAAEVYGRVAIWLRSILPPGGA